MFASFEASLGRLSFVQLGLAILHAETLQQPKDGLLWDCSSVRCHCPLGSLEAITNEESLWVIVQAILLASEVRLEAITGAKLAAIIEERPFL